MTMRDKAITEAFKAVNLNDIIGWFKPQRLLYCIQQQNRYICGFPATP
jgi:hypothetical protein